MLTNAPEDRQKELKGAFTKAGGNLGIKVKITDRDPADASELAQTPSTHPQLVILLYTGFFKIEGNLKRVAKIAEKLIQQRDRTSDNENPTPAADKENPTPAPFLLYSTDSGTSDDMTKHMNEAKDAVQQAG